MLAIVVSRADAASVHIGERLLDVAEWTTHTDEGRPDGEGGGTVYRREGVELREFDATHIDIAAPADAFEDPDLLVFASKHAGKTGPLLTAHHTGNFGAADYGGAAGRFARACPNALRAVVEAMDEHAPEAYDVGIECTHHGPTDVGIPSMFVEVGSAEPQWQDPEAATAVARAILDVADVAADAPAENGTRRHLLGLGGGHYAPRFERVVRETDWAVGHVAADWGLEALEAWADDETAYDAVIERAFAASAADFALLEDDRPDLVATVESLGYRVVDETFVRVTTGVPRPGRDARTRDSVGRRRPSLRRPGHRVRRGLERRRPSDGPARRGPRYRRRSRPRAGRGHSGRLRHRTERYCRDHAGGLSRERVPRPTPRGTGRHSSGPVRQRRSGGWSARRPRDDLRPRARTHRRRPRRPEVREARSGSVGGGRRGGDRAR